MQEPVLGIDLGTTTSCVAAVIEGRPRILSDDDGQRYVPTIVGFTPEGDVVGREARARLVNDPENTVYSFKRLLGRRFDDPWARVLIGGLPYRIVSGPNEAIVIRARGMDYSVPEIAGRILGYLRELAERRLGQPARKAVITAPASFTEQQRAALKIASRIAGLDVIGLLSEPTAAALAFGLNRKDTGVLCVFDFGGGTLDVTVLGHEDGQLKLLGAAGDSLLGGDDLDMAMAFAVAEGFRVETGRSLWRDVAEWQRLLLACEESKRRLSVETSTSIRLRAVARTPSGVRDLNYVLDRKRFQLICGEKIDQTLKSCTEALDQAQLKSNDVDKVILVGGSTFVRLVRSRVADYFHLKPDITVDPVEAVALGAAIHGANLSGSEVDLPDFPRLLSVVVSSISLSSPSGKTPLFKRSEPLPASETRLFPTTDDGQSELRIEIVVQDGSKGGRQIGALVIDGLPSAPAGHVVVEGVFKLDEDHKLTARLIDSASGRLVTERINVLDSDGDH